MSPGYTGLSKTDIGRLSSVWKWALPFLGYVA